ncbi:MAG TPA: tetratricopeptide repeat protein [Acidisarcina sp.]|nr:tetratricopeptide repeat protein [Acidisarcina sp.]
MVILSCGLLSYGQVSKTRSEGSFAILSARAAAARDANQLDEAIGLYKRALVLKANWAEGWWSLATLYYDRGEYAPAAKAFQRLLVLSPQSGTAQLMLGLCQYELGDLDNAQRHFQQARKIGIQDDPKLWHVLMYHESMILVHKAKYESAIESLHRLSKLGVSSEDIDLAYGMCVLLMKPSELPPAGSTERAVVVRVGHAEAMDSRETHDTAKKLYKEAVEATPAFPNIHYAYGRFLLTIQEPDEALPQFAEELKLQPNHVRARLQIAAIHYRTDSATGIPYAREAVRLAPDFPFAHYLLGLLYLDSGDAASAIPELETAKAMVPIEPRFYFSLARAYAKVGRKKEAEETRAAFVRLSQPAGADASSSAGKATPDSHGSGLYRLDADTPQR